MKIKVHMGWFPIWLVLWGGFLEPINMNEIRQVYYYIIMVICHGALKQTMASWWFVLLLWLHDFWPKSLVNLSVEKWSSQLGPRSLGFSDWRVCLWAVIQSHCKRGLDYSFFFAKWFHCLRWSVELNEQHIPLASWSRATSHGRQAMNVMDCDLDWKCRQSNLWTLDQSERQTFGILPLIVWT